MFFVAVENFIPIARLIAKESLGAIIVIIFINVSSTVCLFIVIKNPHPNLGM